MKIKLIKNKKYLQQKFSRKVHVPQTTANFTSRVSKSYVPFTCKLPMVIHFVPILHRRRKSKTNFYVFSYDITSLKFLAPGSIHGQNPNNPLSELCEKRNSIAYCTCCNGFYLFILFSSSSNNVFS